MPIAAVTFDCFPPPMADPPGRETSSYSESELPEPRLARFLFADTRLAPLWAILRLYVGWQWLLAGYEMPHAATFSYVVAFGELLVGAALILGLLTGFAAFFGGFMNASYLLAGTVSTNPALFIVQTMLVLAWRVAGWWGLDRWVLPRIGAMSSRMEREVL